MSNPATFMKQFQYLTQSYNVSFHDNYRILSNNLLPEDHRRVWEQARQNADEIHQTLSSHASRTEVVPEQETQWEYYIPGGILARDQFLTCLLEGLCKAVVKPVNYAKLSEIIQDTKENPSTFLKRLTKALL